MSNWHLNDDKPDLIVELQGMLNDNNWKLAIIRILLDYLKTKPDVVWLTRADDDNIHLHYNYAALKVLQPDIRSFERALKHLMPWTPRAIQTHAEIKIWRFEYVEVAVKRAKVECPHCGNLYAGSASLTIHISKHCKNLDHV